MITGANNVNNNITSIVQRKRAAIFALCLYYAGLALNYFRAQQANGAYWANRTGQARDRVFSGPISENDVLGWFLAHGVRYGIYLELTNDGQNAALEPVVGIFAKQFLSDVKRIIA